MTMKRYFKKYAKLDDVYHGFEKSKAVILEMRSVLMHKLVKIIQKSKMDGLEAAKHFNCNPCDISHLLNGKIHMFSLDKLIRMVTKEGYEVTIKIRRK